MHDRKAAAMADRAEAFIMLPGGFVTFEEFLEVVTWTQLGVHSKPCGVLNVQGFFVPLVALFDVAVQQPYVRTEHRETMIVESDPMTMLQRLGQWTPVIVDKWIDRSER